MKLIDHYKGKHVLVSDSICDSEQKCALKIVLALVVADLLFGLDEDLRFQVDEDLDDLRIAHPDHLDYVVLLVLLDVEGNWVPNLFEEFFVVQHDLLQHILLNVHINLFVRNLEQLEDVVDVYVSDAGAEFQQLFLMVFLFEGDV